MEQRKRVTILQVPVDVLNSEDLEGRFRELFKPSEGPRTIYFITYKDLIRAQFNKPLRKCLQGGHLNIPISPAIPFATRFLGLSHPPIYNPFTFIIQLLSFLERSERTLYILGAAREDLLRSESNLKISFPRLKIVGRYAGNLTSQEKESVLTTVHKTAPALLLTGSCLKGGKLWLWNNREKLPAGLALAGMNCFEIFSQKCKRPRDYSRMRTGLGVFFSLLLPWQLLGYLFFLTALLVQKARGRGR